MPTYDFTCTKCAHAFEHRQSMDAEPKTVCPQCGKEARREFSMNVNFQFKGDGFYITDYRSDSYKKDVAKDKAASDKNAKKPKASDAKKKPVLPKATKSSGDAPKSTTPSKHKK